MSTRKCFFIAAAGVYIVLVAMHFGFQRRSLTEEESKCLDEPCTRFCSEKGKTFSLSSFNSFFRLSPRLNLTVIDARLHCDSGKIPDESYEFVSRKWFLCGADFISSLLRIH
jgi:hypothetical protein